MTTHHPLRWLLPLSLLIAVQARAEAGYGPQLCAVPDLKLEVRNPKSELLPFWLQIREDGRLIDERTEELGPGETRLLSGTDFLQEGQSFSVRQRGADLRFTLDCAGRSPMTSSVSPRADFDLGSSDEAFLVRLQNLHPGAQLVTVQFLGGADRVVSSATIALSKPYVSSETKLERPPGARRLRLLGEGRISVRVLGSRDLKERPARASLPAEVDVPPANAFFLLSNDSGSEAFVVSTDRADLAEQARRLIREGSYKISFAVAETAARASENRDFASPGAPPWSWRVKELTGFADLGHQDCSGSPSLLEDRMAAGDERLICFWSFRLRRELSADDVRTGVLRRP